MLARNIGAPPSTSGYRRSWKHWYTDLSRTVHFAHRQTRGKVVFSFLWENGSIAFRFWIFSVSSARITLLAWGSKSNVWKACSPLVGDQRKERRICKDFGRTSGGPSLPPRAITRARCWEEQTTTKNNDKHTLILKYLGLTDGANNLGRQEFHHWKWTSVKKQKCAQEAGIKANSRAPFCRVHDVDGRVEILPQIFGTFPKSRPIRYTLKSSNAGIDTLLGKWRLASACFANRESFSPSKSGETQIKKRWDEGKNDFHLQWTKQTYITPIFKVMESGENKSIHARTFNVTQ